VLDLKSLKVFLTVADLANMTAAARQLGLSQSAVSQTVRQLEETIGAVLIARERRPLALTAAGVALRQRGGALVAEAETLYRMVREQAGTQAQLLRLGMVDSFASTVGPSLVRHLLTSAVEMHVASGLGPDLGRALVERRLDMIVTTRHPESNIVLAHDAVLSERYVLLVARSHAAGPSRADRPPTLAALAKALPLVRFNVDSHIGAQIEHYLRERGVVAPRRLEIDTAETLVAMVAANVGWAMITPLCLLQARADPAAVSVVPLPEPLLARELTLVSRAGEYGELPRTIAKASGDILRNEWVPRLGALAPWLAETVRIG
jgi:DNA-binding transcriptional LysR family regulator